MCTELLAHGNGGDGVMHGASCKDGFSRGRGHPPRHDIAAIHADWEPRPPSAESPGQR
jgi:hypothetical protein